MDDLTAFRRLAAAARGLVVLATPRPDGSVHASVVSAGVLDDPVGGRPVVAMVVRGGAVKLRHLRRSGRATVVARDGWEWAGVEGTVRVAGPDDPLDGLDPAHLPRLLRDVFTAAGGTHEDWAEYDRVMAAERRAAVLVSPTRLLANG